tara:strand:- start:109 stop:498 length:390 start_codon:yes stop_codon:yes gene_type:complete
MTTQERIYSKLNLHKDSVELSAERIELNAEKEARDFMIKAEKIYNNSKKDAADDILSGAFKMNDGLKKLNKLSGEVDKMFARIDKIGKELGVDIRKTTAGKNLTKAAQDIKDYQIKFQTAESKLRKFKI